MNFEEKLASIDQNIRFVPGVLSTQQTSENIFLFDIPGCHGNLFSVPLGTCLRGKYEDDVYHFCARADDEKDIEALAKALDDSQKQQYAGLVVSASGYWAYDMVGIPMQRVAIITDPYKRLVNLYVEQCYQQGHEPNKQEFEQLINDPVQNNLMCKALASRPPVNGEVTVDDVVSHMVDHFHAFVTEERSNDLLSCYLSRAHLPNVLTNFIIPDMSEWYDMFSEYRDRVYDTHSADYLLFQFVESYPKFPAVSIQDAKLSSVTAIFEDQVNEGRHQLAMEYVDTMNMVQNVMKSDQPSLQQLMETSSLQ